MRNFSSIFKRKFPKMTDSKSEKRLEVDVGSSVWMNALEKDKWSLKI
jgi:hypothetical protein